MKKDLALLNTFSFVKNLQFFGALAVPFYTERIGFSFTQGFTLLEHKVFNSNTLKILRLFKFFIKELEFLFGKSKCIFHVSFLSFMNILYLLLIIYWKVYYSNSVQFSVKFAMQSSLSFFVQNPKSKATSIPRSNNLSAMR